MSLKFEIYLPKETIEDIENVQDLILGLGDLLSVDYGNSPPEDFGLEELNSFIIITDEELPDPENFENMDMFFVIPIESEDSDD